MGSQHSEQQSVTNPPLEPSSNDSPSHDVQDRADDSDVERASETKEAGEETFQKQTLTTIVLLTTTSSMALFLIALDRTIITTV